MKTKILVTILVLVLVVTIPGQAFAGKYEDRTFSFFNGKYNSDNGEIKFNGVMKYTQYYIKITGIGQLKEWKITDSSIPNCKHAFADDFTILFNNKYDHAKLYITGKMCSGNYSNQWKTFQGNYIVYTGDVEHAENISGSGIMEFIVNTKTNELLVGKMAGNIILYT